MGMFDFNGGFGTIDPQVKIAEMNLAAQQAMKAQELTSQGIWNSEKLKLYKDQMAQFNNQSKGINDLLNSYNAAYNTAKAQNEQKYQSQLGLVDSVTGQKRADTISNYEKQSADAMQNLARLGMANTTVGATTKAGVKREMQSELNRLADQMAGTKLGVMQGFNYQGADSGVTQAAIAALAPKTQSFSFS
jgi:hypothetical protein